MDPQSKFTNVSGGVAGAVKLDHEGHAAGVAVFPNESVWLTEKEEILTANAPRNEADNPFVNGTFRCDVKSADAGHSRPIGSKHVNADPPERPAEAGEGDPENIDLRVETPAANEPPPQAAAEPPAPPTAPTPPPQPPAPPVEDPAAAESLAPVEEPKAPVTPEPEAGQSKRDARAQAPAPKAQPKPATPAAPAPAPAPTPAAAPKPAPSE